MSTYVISDIHGCYDTFIKLLEKVNFSSNDNLYILGDIIDRGPKSYEMYLWVKERLNKNVYMILGNHEYEFYQEAYGIKGYELYKKKQEENYIITPEEKEDYDYFTKSLFGFIEDHYGTIKKLKDVYNLTNDEIIDMGKFFESLPLFYKITVDNKEYTLTHACYSPTFDVNNKSLFIWERALTIENCFVKDHHIIFGHTPTITEEYNGVGNIITSVYDDNTSKTNIDCGCVWRRKNSKLGILRLDNFEAIYQENIEI